LGAKI